MEILNGLRSQIDALGPMGVLAVAGAILAAVLIRNRFGPQPAPVVPTPEPTHAVAPKRLDAQFPFLHALAVSLGWVPRDRPATTDDVKHADLLQLKAEIDRMVAAKAAQHAAAVADLNPSK